MSKKRSCAVEGCDNPVSTRHYCREHASESADLGIFNIVSFQPLYI